MKRWRVTRLVPVPVHAHVTRSQSDLICARCHIQALDQNIMVHYNTHNLAACNFRNFSPRSPAAAGPNMWNTKDCWVYRKFKAPRILILLGPMRRSQFPLEPILTLTLMWCSSTSRQSTMAAYIPVARKSRNQLLVN